MKILSLVLLILLLLTQYRLWVGEGSIAHVSELKRNIAKQEAENQRLKAQNQNLALEVEALRSGLDAVEARAREELGLIKKGETFFLFIDPEEQ
ncbi:cell division protein FtsB [Agaribacterium haliotis]|uniref:cell division protein FtsB n=1 Tax=Agaribacterium haliotis TaxID=2013869 RepID=UPI000BB56B73|nr:cell division protein FtsB [Agaribacterium haliotis]